MTDASAEKLLLRCWIHLELTARSLNDIQVLGRAGMVFIIRQANIIVAGQISHSSAHGVCTALHVLLRGRSVTALRYLALANHVVKLLLYVVATWIALVRALTGRLIWSVLQISPLQLRRHDL